MFALDSTIIIFPISEGKIENTNNLDEFNNRKQEISTKSVKKKLFKPDIQSTSRYCLLVIVYDVI